jgi:hypothetical protein
MNKAQAQFIAEDFLKRFSNNYTIINAEDLPILEQILIKAGLEFNAQVVSNLEKSGSISTGALAEIGFPSVIQNDNSITLQIGYPLDSKQIKYYDYINKGVSGVGGKNARPKKTSGIYKFKTKYPNRAMASAIYGWLNRARKSVRNNDTYKPTNTIKKKRKLAKVLSESENKRRLAYAVSSSIKRNGISANYYFDKAYNKVFNQEFIESLETALAGEVTLQIKNLYGSNITK